MTTDVNELLPSLLKKYPAGRPIIHVGAFEGTNTFKMAQMFPDRIVHAIEPCLTAFGQLRKKTFQQSNVRLHQLAITDKDGEGVLNIGDNINYKKGFISSQSNSLYQDFVERKSKSVTSQPVQLVTLDTFCQTYLEVENIGLLKLNCEGSEYEIFNHMPSLDWIKRTDVLYICLHGKSNKFNSPRYELKKRCINGFLVGSDFKIVYGQYLSELDVLPKGHAIQVWIKRP